MTERQMKLGVCYYPEHWPESQWEQDARDMKAMGISVVRVGEFSWSRLEPDPGRLDLDWLRRSLDTLGAEGLEVCLGTPTATPPKWLVDQRPEILAWDEKGQPRRFGSRRHYCFSSSLYRQQSRRITQIVTEAFGDHPAVKYWQTDNEYGCHNTVRSYSPSAEIAFRGWLEVKYQTVNALNEAWGTVFWSQEYRSFGEVDLPNMTVTEPNPSHVLDFYRFSSDQVASFNREQVEIIRAYSPGRPITHNYMGFYAEFDHFKVGEDLDFASWDSYPLGFLDQGWDDEATKARYMRQGHPDFAAFHHDLYRAVGKGRLWVMEQQPGPVNWAPHNPAPLSGMVHAWTVEAFGHGADVVSYFRWRQAPFAQEQMHAGLKRPDGQDTAMIAEVRQAAKDVASKSARPSQAPLALIFSYDAFWMFEVQPQGAGWSYWQLVMDWYGALRQQGLSVDIIAPGHDLAGYKAVFVPSLPHIDEATMAAFKASEAHLVFGPRSGSKTESLTVPETLAPGPLKALLDITVTKSESFAPFHKMEGQWNGTHISSSVWLDHVEGMDPLVTSLDGEGLIYRRGRTTYLTSVPDRKFLRALVRDVAGLAGIDLTELPEGLRYRDHGNHTMVINYAPETNTVPGALSDTVGSTSLARGSALLVSKSEL